MTIFYSASLNGFIDESLFAAEDIPLDAQPITEQHHQALLLGQSDRKEIVADSKGNPVLIDKPQAIPSPAEMVLKIDAYAVAKYAYLNRFEVEYRERATAARSFRNAGYSGEPSIWITSFAQAAGIDSRSATDRIIVQADALTDAFAQLAALRMRKYEVSELQGQAALERAKEITAAMDQVVANID